MPGGIHNVIRVMLAASVALLLSPCLISPVAAAAAPPVNETISLIDEIDTINTKLAEIEREYGALIESLDDFNAQADEAVALRRTAQSDLEAKKERFNRRVVALYKSGRTSWFSVLVDSRNVLDFLDRITWSERVVRQDAESLRAVKAAADSARALEVSIVEKRRTLNSRCNWAIQQKSSLSARLDECMKRLSAADPVLAKVVSQPQTELSRRIDAYLAKRRSPLTGYGIVFVQAERRTGVSATLLVGLTAAESSCATAGTYSRTNHNAWGMKGPQPRIAGGIPAKYGFCTWDNWAIAIQQAADFVLHYWGPARTARELRGYCETGGPGSDWERRVETSRTGI